MARTSFSHLHGGSGRGFARRGHGIFYYGEGSAASDACTQIHYVHKLDVASLAANRRPPSRNEILRSWAVPSVAGARGSSNANLRHPPARRPGPAARAGTSPRVRPALARDASHLVAPLLGLVALRFLRAFSAHASCLIMVVYTSFLGCPQRAVLRSNPPKTAKRHSTSRGGSRSLRFGRLAARLVDAILLGVMMRLRRAHMDIFAALKT